MSTATCSFCYDEVPCSQIVDELCIDHSDHEPVCRSCITYYITDRINSSFLGACPSMHCPCVHKDGKRKLMKFPHWKQVVGTSAYAKYEKLAESLVAFLCGSCHALKSLLIRYDSNGQDELAQQLTVEAHELLRAAIARYESGEDGIDELYKGALPVAFPGFDSTHTDAAAHENLTSVLRNIANPERRANLQLRHYRSRPRVWTHCCSKEHCYRCQTKDFHEGRSCEENRLSLGPHLYDSSTVPCPSCGVCLAKGDGCNTVVCVCGRQFQWQAEKLLAENCQLFAKKHPAQTSWAAVNVLCRAQEGSQAHANAWRQRHSVGTNQGFLRWWREQHPACPSQCCLTRATQRQVHVPPARYGPGSNGYGYGSALSVDGVREARELWRSTHPAEVAHCEAQRDTAIGALFLAQAPTSQRAATAVRLLSNIYTYHEASAEPAASGEGSADDSTSLRNRLWVSAQRWVNTHYAEYKQARFEHDARSALQFLLVYGSRRVTTTIDSQTESGHVLAAGRMRRQGMYYTCATRWDQRCSNQYLSYFQDDSVVARSGGVSCYPAAVAPLPCNQSMITLRLDACPRSCNILSFGISYRPRDSSRAQVQAAGAAREPFPLHNSHGVGRIPDTFGLVDERQTSYMSSSGSPESPTATSHALLYASVERVGHFRKLQQGDILQGVANTEDGWFDLHLDGADNSDQSGSSSPGCVHSEQHWHHRFRIPIGSAEDYAFAVTLANDHRLAVVDSSTAVNHHHNTASVALRGVSTCGNSPSSGPGQPAAAAAAACLASSPCYVAPSPSHLSMMACYRKLLAVVVNTPLPIVTLATADGDAPADSDCDDSTTSNGTQTLRLARRALSDIAGTCARPCAGFQSETQQALSLVQPYARHWAAVSGTANALGLYDAAPDKPTEKVTETAPATTPHGHPLPCHATSVSDLTPAQLAVFARCDEAHFAQDGTTECGTGFTQIATHLPGRGANSTGTAHKASSGGSSCSAEVDKHGPISMRGPEELTAYFMRVAAAFQARASLQPLTHRASPAARALLTWENLLAAACFDRARRLAARREACLELAAAFLAQHGVDATFMAAAICAGATHATTCSTATGHGSDNGHGPGNGDGSSTSRLLAFDTGSATEPADGQAPSVPEMATAFMAAYSFEMHEWYDSNAACADPLLVEGGRAGLIPECRCLPRHFKTHRQTPGYTGAPTSCCPMTLR